jgi:hypothetical protein
MGGPTVAARFSWIEAECALVERRKKERRKVRRGVMVGKFGID